MVFVKGKKSHNFSGGPREGYFNTERFDSMSMEEGYGNGYSVCGYMYVGEGNGERVLLRDGFTTKEEADSWLAAKAEEWGIVLADPNH